MRTRREFLPCFLVGGVGLAFTAGDAQATIEQPLLTQDSWAAQKAHSALRVSCRARRVEHTIPTARARGLACGLDDSRYIRLTGEARESEGLRRE